MTVAIAWVRRILGCEELLFVSDSRLSGDGRIFDAAPKILTLPRGDCAIAFAGNTENAFPMMLQLSLSIASHAPARRRSIDITDLATHARKVFDNMEQLITSDAHVRGSPPDQEPPAEFLFGGYSWIKKRFELWRIHYDHSERSYVADAAPWVYFSRGGKKVEIRARRKPPREHLLGRIAFAGDQAELAKKMVRERLAEDCLSDKAVDKIDMQPFEVVRDMLRNPERSHTIGGAPQLVKVYQFMQAVAFAVYWPDKVSGIRFLQGRPCLGYERLDIKVFDPTLHARVMKELVPARSAT
jgi:hypothetical protein